MKNQIALIIIVTALFSCNLFNNNADDPALLKDVEPMEIGFWETHENAEIYEYLAKANDKLRVILETQLKPEDSQANAEPPLDGPNPVTVEDAGADTALSLLDMILNDTSESEKEKTKLIDFRVFARENPLLSILEPSLYEEDGRYFPAKGPVVGYAEVKDTARINDYLDMPQIKSIFPSTVKFLWTAKPFDTEEKFVMLIAIRVTNVDGAPPMDGGAIKDARQGFGFDNSPSINITMDDHGAHLWKRLTTENVGRSIAIVLDDKVYSFPTVQSAIINGRTEITGGFTIEEAQELARKLTEHVYSLASEK